MRPFLAKCIFAVSLTTVLGVLSAAAGDRAAPAQSRMYGKSLTEWMTLYWESLINGGPDQVGKVKFLPLPEGEYVSGDFTFDDPGVLVGELEVQLSPGTGFALPVSAWIGESYLPEPGYPPPPDDLPLDRSIFTIAEVTLDGNPLISEANSDQYYYGPSYFDPPVVYSEPTDYGADAAIFVQGIGFVHHPLSRGTHTLELAAAIQIEDYDFGVVFHNTWTIVVGK